MLSYNEIEKCLIKTQGKISYIGVTHLGYPIPMITKGGGSPVRILLVGGVHAREYITSYLLCELMCHYQGNCQIDCIPILNIDGVLLCRLGCNLFSDNSKLMKELLHLNNGDDNFSLWKANIRGVDINVNFNVDWGTGLLNTRSPSSQNYIGQYPESENETQTLVELLYRNDYNMVVAYHSKGEEIYYGYKEDKSYYEESQRIADYLQYQLKTSDNSAGGLKDYVVDKLKKYAITIEVGEDRFSHPYPLCELDNLLEKHRNSLELFCEIGEKICKKNL